MSEVVATMVDMRECPYHEGAFDCTPFCRVCEGNQEYQYTETLPCAYCATPVEHDTWFAEMEMCLDCSNAYFDHDREYFAKINIPVYW